uniref:Uncharacterized protein n=1 Tax=Anguilla anguilla TaxID=7936 RepID=A0A0E9XWK8_ANGAN
MKNGFLNSQISTIEWLTLICWHHGATD